MPGVQPPYMHREAIYLRPRLPEVPAEISLLHFCPAMHSPLPPMHNPMKGLMILENIQV